MQERTALEESLGSIGRIEQELDDQITMIELGEAEKDAKVVAYDRCGGYRGSIYAGMPKIPSEINVKLDVPLFGNTGGAAFLYLWQPGEAH